MRRMFVFLLCMVPLISCGDRNPVDSGDRTGTAVIQCAIEPAKPAVSEELKPTASAVVSFYDAQGTRVVNQSLTVSGKHITGTVKVKAGSGYRVELQCYDRYNVLTHSGEAANVSIVAGQQTSIMIHLKPAIPDTPTITTTNIKTTSGEEFTLSWTEVSRAASYTVEHGTDSNFGDAEQENYIDTTDTETIVTDTDTVYYFRVRANNASGSSGWSNVVSITIAAVKHALILDVSPQGSGDTDPPAGSYSYGENAVVTISATPSQGFRFVSWTGGVSNPASATTTVTMTGEKHVTATFEQIPPENHTLTMAVNTAAWGSTDPATGTHTYSDGTVITITAMPASGYRFAGWTGNVANASSAATTVTVTADMTVTVNFEKIPQEQYTLTMEVNNAAWGTITPSAGAHTYDSGTTVTITATPVQGYRFAGWTGVVADATNATTTVLMDKDKTVSATFTAATVDQYTLTVAVNNPAQGTTNPSAGSYSYKSGSVVTLTATPFVGYRFVGWTGAVIDANSATTTATITGDMTVTANFERIQYSLTLAVNPSGGGTTDPATGAHTYGETAVVAIQATPATGYRFVSWSGDVADASSAATTVIMNGDKTVTANFELIPTASKEITMVSIPGGTFQMGSNLASDEQPIHTVILSAFEMSMYEITQGQYKTIIGTNPSYFSGDENLPVEQVSWYDVVSFCNKLSDDAGLERCYDESTWECDFSKNGYRLPTEAEWEYACRAGKTTTYNTGDSESDLARAGWYSTNSGSKTHTVGQKTANTLGLYDMHGNVWEWCYDWYGSYSSGSVINPTGSQTGSYRVDRGGSWYDIPYVCRVASRGGSLTPFHRGYNIGFRVVRGEHQVAPVKYTLTMAVNTIGWGTTTPSVGSASYDEGTIVNIAATPASGYRFLSWTGSVANSSSAATTVTMNGDRTVTANFEKITYTISGAVTGVDGVTVTLSGDATGSQTVDNGGTYTFTVAQGGSYLVTPSRYGCTFTPENIVLNNVQKVYSQNFKCTIFEDTYTSNYNTWIEKDTEDVRLQVQSGRYVFEHKRDTSGWIVLKSILLDISADFTIETTLIHESGVTNYGYGLVFGALDTENYYYFRISGGGYFSYSKRINNNSTDIIASEKTAFINTGDATNTLTVRRSQSQLHFLINGNEVGQAPFEQFFGDKMGYKVDNLQTIGVDSIKISVQ